MHLQAKVKPASLALKWSATAVVTITLLLCCQIKLEIFNLNINTLRAQFVFMTFWSVGMAPTTHFTLDTFISISVNNFPARCFFFSKNFINLLMVEGFTAAETVKSGGKDPSAHSWGSPLEKEKKLNNHEQKTESGLFHSCVCVCGHIHTFPLFKCSSRTTSKLLQLVMN